MNLTKGLLGAIIKYPVSFAGDRQKERRYPYKEDGIFLRGPGSVSGDQESTGTFGKRHPLAFVLEAADDIAYRTADIEDAFKKGALPSSGWCRNRKTTVRRNRTGIIRIWCPFWNGAEPGRSRKESPGPMPTPYRTGRFRSRER